MSADFNEAAAMVDDDQVVAPLTEENYDRIPSDPYVPYRKFTAEEQQGAVPSQRSQIAMTACPPRHSLFCMGGVVDNEDGDDDSDKPPLQVFEFDLRTGVWTEHKPKTGCKQKWGMKCVYRRADHSIYCFGGNIGNRYIIFRGDGVFKLDLTTFEWRDNIEQEGLKKWRQATGNTEGFPYPNMIKSTSANNEEMVPLGIDDRYCHAMELKPDQSGFVVFGGQGYRFEYNDFIEFDFRDLMWKEIEVLAGKKPKSRQIHASAMTASNKFFIFGGRREITNIYANTTLDVLEYFDFNSKTWFTVDWNYSFPAPRFAAAFSSFQSYGRPKFISKSMKFNHNFESQYEYLILHGGRNDEFRHKSTHIYNIEEQVWKDCKLVDDSLSEVDIQQSEENLKSSMKRVTLNKERKLMKKILSDDDILFRGGNIGLCVGYNDINFKSNFLFYDYEASKTTFSRPIVSSYPTTLSKKFISFGGKTGRTDYTVYDSSLLTFDLTHFDYQNDPSLLVNPTKSASTDAVFEELSIKLLKDNFLSDYTLISSDGTAFSCHKFILSHIQYFRELFDKKADVTHLSASTLNCLLKYCYGIELTPNDIGLSYHVEEESKVDEFIDIYSSIYSLAIQDMIEYLRKLFFISMDSRKATSFFNYIHDNLQSSNNVALKDLARLTVGYIYFNVFPTIKELQEEVLDTFLGQAGVTDEKISLFKSYSSQIDNYETKRVRLAREYMYTNFSMLMNSSLQYSKVNTNVTLSLTVEEKTWKITLPKALFCARFDYFNSLINMSVLDESDVIDISPTSMVLYSQSAPHPLLTLAALIYFTFTNDVDYENVILCKSVFPTCDNEDITPSFEINQETITHYIIEMFSVADYIADISLKESLLQYIRRLVSSGVLSCSGLEEAAKELQKVDFDVMAEIAEIFLDCALEQRAIEFKVKQQEQKALEMKKRIEEVKKRIEETMIYDSDDGDDGDDEDDDLFV